MAPNTVAEASQVIKVGLVRYKCVRMGAVVSRRFSWHTASWQSVVQTQGASFFNSWFRGDVVAEYCGKKLR